MGILWLLLANICGICKTVSVKKCGQKASGARNGIKINFFRSAICLIVSFAVFLFSPHSGDIPGLWFSLLAGTANVVLLFSWLIASQYSSLCAVEIFCMIGAVIIPMILAPLLYAGESVSPMQWTGAGLLIVSAFLISPHEKKNKRFSGKTVMFLILCTVSNAGVAVSQKLFTAYANASIAYFNLISFTVVFFAFGIAEMICFLYEKTDNKEEKVKKNFFRQTWMYIAISSVMLYANQYFSTTASGYFSSAVFYPIMYAIMIPLDFLADLMIFKEKFKIIKLCGAFCAVAAILFVFL